MLSEIVTELLQLLDDAKAVAPIAEDAGAGAETRPSENHEAALKLKTSFYKRFDKDPAGATAANKAKLASLRLMFSNTYSGMPNDSRLDTIRSVFGDMVAIYGEVVEEIALRARVKDELAALAPAGASGGLLVAGATDDDTKPLERLRDAAALALADAPGRAEVQAAQASLGAIAQERAAVQARVLARTQQAERIRLDAAAVVAPPEAPDGALATERAAVLAPLVALPLADAALATAETALLALLAAGQQAEAEAASLRQMRALFAADAQQLRVRLQALASQVPKRKQPEADKLQKEIVTAEKSLAVKASRVQTEGFPAALDNVRIAVNGLSIGGMGGGNAQTDAAGSAYFREELRLLSVQLDELPLLDDESIGYRDRATEKKTFAASNLPQGGHKGVAGARAVQDMADIITMWRAHVGPLGIVLGQRKTAVADALAKVKDPADCLAAFSLAIEAQRKKVRTSLAKPLNDVNVQEAEANAALLPPLLQQADDDAKAAKLVAASRLILSKELDAVIAAARPTAGAVLARLRDEADRRAALSTVGRDMAGTAGLHDALIVRMRAVAAEASFADADKAPFADIDEGVRELAFNVFGPALVPTLDKAAKQALSAVLVSDGKAIAQLADSAFGDNAKVMAQVVGTCGAEGLATLARALDGDANAATRAALEGLMDKGGLAGNPALLARLLGDAPKATDSVKKQTAQRARQARGIESIQSLADNFSGDDGQAALSTLMVDCGFDSSGGTLASLMDTDGFDGKGDELRAFADAFTGSGKAAKTAQADLSRVVKTAGVKEHPKVLGPLAKRAGAKGVKDLGAAFALPADCANLKGLLDGGGMSGDVDQPDQEHEHPDTLGKVFVDGLGGKGKNLKTYAEAFKGADGQADSKRMLDAFNELPEKHAKFRKPGVGIGKLLAGNQLKGATEEERIKKLATQFLPQIKAIPEGDQRQQAIRMAPSVGTETAQEGFKPQSDDMKAAGIKRVTASVLRRHKPETFDRTKMGAGVQSMFPPDCDVGALLDEAMGKISADRTRAQTVTVTIAVSPPPTQITVEIGFINGDTVNHFGPRGNPGPPHPNETPLFNDAEINAIYAAIK